MGQDLMVQALECVPQACDVKLEVSKSLVLQLAQVWALHECVDLQGQKELQLDSEQVEDYTLRVLAGVGCMLVLAMI